MLPLKHALRKRAGAGGGLVMGGSPFWRPSRWSSPCHGRIPPRQCPPHLHHWWMVHSLPWEVGWTLPFLFIAQLSLPCSSRRAPALRLKAAATRGRGSGGRVVRSRLSAAPPPPRPPGGRRRGAGGHDRCSLPGPTAHLPCPPLPSALLGGGSRPLTGECVLCGHGRQSAPTYSSHLVAGSTRNGSGGRLRWWGCRQVRAGGRPLNALAPGDL